MDERPPVDLAVLEMLPIGVFAASRDWKIFLWNRTLALWTGIEPAEALGRDLRAVLPRLDDRRHLSRLEALMEGGPPVVFSYQLHADLFPDSGGRGPRRARYCAASALPGAAGILFSVEDRTEVAALVRDAGFEISRRRAVEEELRSALAAKEMLIREASHRVKNSLAIIVSLINLESEKAGSDSARGFLLDLESRVSSIGLIHELLYKGDIGSAVRLDEYLGKLCTSVVETLSPKDAEVKLVLKTESAFLSVDDTLHLGMMAAELVTNSLKYARSSDGSLTIRITLRREEGEGLLELLVEDEGPGFPEGRIPRSSSLGWSLIEIFASELGGTAQILPGPGARVALRFPERKAPGLDKMMNQG